MGQLNKSIQIDQTKKGLGAPSPNATHFSTLVRIPSEANFKPPPPPSSHRSRLNKEGGGGRYAWAMEGVLCRFIYLIKKDNHEIENH